MCGIVGYIGNKNAAGVLLDGLKKLEYRGYDSAGVAIYTPDGLNVIKRKGRLSNLEAALAPEMPGGTLGIGHTRWATHGEPNDINSHPHLSQSGSIAVVHNGIIENYMELKEFLAAKGFVFQSDTDTEVVAHLIEHNYQGDLKAALIKSISEIEGSYALGVICSDHPDEFAVARKDSPLIIGLGDGENFAASDIPAILSRTREILILEDREIAVLSRNGIKIFNIYGDSVAKTVTHIAWDVAAAEKGGYEHFMIKEICEEPAVVRDTIASGIRNGKLAIDYGVLTEEYFARVRKIFIVACGTAYHAGVAGKYIIEKYSGIPVEVDVASEFRYRDPLIDESTLVLIISQSGETLDTLAALKEAKRKGCRILSVVNVVGSSIARASDEVIYTRAGPEIAVASTKAYNTQLAVLYMLAIDFGRRTGNLPGEVAARLIGGLMSMPANIEAAIGSKELIQKFAAHSYNSRSIFFIGRGLDYALSMEGSLKLKEISYIHSEAYAGGELKHGTIALIEEGTLVVCPITQDMLFEKMISNVKEVKARGATVLAVTTEKNREQALKAADEVITIPDVESDLTPLCAVTLLQLFAYYMAVLKGCDVDKPRNLAKSVTVE